MTLPYKAFPDHTIWKGCWYATSPPPTKENQNPKNNNNKNQTPSPANFCGKNTLILGAFKLPTWCHWTQSWEEKLTIGLRQLLRNPTDVAEITPIYLVFLQIM